MLFSIFSQTWHCSFRWGKVDTFSRVSFWPKTVGSWIPIVADLAAGLKMFDDMRIPIKVELFNILTLNRLQGNRCASKSLEIKTAIVCPCFTTSQRTRRNICIHGTVSRNRAFVFMMVTTLLYFKCWQLCLFCHVLYIHMLICLSSRYPPFFSIAIARKKLQCF